MLAERCTSLLQVFAVLLCHCFGVTRLSRVNRSSASDAVFDSIEFARASRLKSEEEAARRWKTLSEESTALIGVRMGKRCGRERGTMT